MTYCGDNVEWLDSVSLTSIINVSIGSGGSGCVSRIWQSQYGTIDMSQYSITWWYMLCTLANDKINKTLRHCHIDFIALKEETIVTMTLLTWMTWCKKDVELRLSCMPSVSSLAWVWWVITRMYGSTLHYYVRTQYWSTWPIEQGSV